MLKELPQVAGPSHRQTLTLPPLPELQDPRHPGLTFRYGLISGEGNGAGFLNPIYAAGLGLSQRELDSPDSSRYYVNQLQLQPASACPYDRSEVYVVRYATSGTSFNASKNRHQPAVCYAWPAQVLLRLRKSDLYVLLIRGTDLDVLSRVPLTLEPAPLAAPVLPHRAPAQPQRPAAAASPTPEPQVLEELLRQGKWADYLRSPLLARRAPNALPAGCLENAIHCARMLLEPGERKPLTEFQLQLMTESLTRDFLASYREGDGFSSRMIRLSAQTSLARFDPDQDPGRIVREIKRVGLVRSDNGTWAGLLDRMAACADELIPCLYLLLVFTGEATPEESLSDYCRIIRDMRRRLTLQQVDTRTVLASFPQVLGVLRQHFWGTEGIPQSLITNVFSLLLDTNNVGLMPQVLPLAVPDPNAWEYRLMDLMNRPEEWTEEQFRDLEEKKTNLQVFQKAIAYIWDRFRFEEVLPEYYLRLLGWVTRYCGHGTVDEVLRYGFSQDFTRRRRQTILLSSLPRCLELMDREAGMYPLACFIVRYVCPDCSENQFTPEGKAALEGWETLAEARYQTLCHGREGEQLLPLLGLFRLDPPHHALLQDRYARWVLAQPEEGTPEETLDRLFADGAWEAWLRRFDRGDVPGDKPQLERFAHCHIALGRYPELMEKLSQREIREPLLRENLILRAICENFRENGLSDQAFALFRGEFSREKAIRLLTDGYAPNRIYLLPALMALYYTQGEYEKAFYLYQLHQDKVEVGFSRFFGQFRSRILQDGLQIYAARATQHYGIVQLAMYSLLPEELMAFLTWAGKVPIPRNHEAANPLSQLYDRVLRSPEDPESWLTFYQHLAQRPEQNAWMLVVCCMVLKERLAFAGELATGQHLRTFLEQAGTMEPRELPRNLLPYLFRSIMAQPDSDLLRGLDSLLSRNDRRKWLMETNPWYPRYASEAERFKTFCLLRYSQTQDGSCYTVLARLGMALDVADMKQLSQAEVDKQYLFTSICGSFLEGKNQAGIRELLENAQWNDLSDREQSFLDLLRMLYRDNEELIGQWPELYPGAESVARLKRDCARILREYPGLRGLTDLDDRCQDMTHKLLVCSWVFPVLYSEDLYDKYWVRHSDFRDRREFLACLSFLNTAYWVQLRHNASFDLLYKRFRYLKLYLNLVLRQGVGADDSQILEAMGRNGHYEEIFSGYYRPFKTLLDGFCRGSSLPEEARECWLYGLMTGKLADFFQRFEDRLLVLPPEQRLQMRQMTAMLDFRVASYEYYVHFLPRMEAGSYEAALAAAESVCDYARETVLALKADPEGLPIFKRMLARSGHQPRINLILEQKPREFTRFQPILTPLYCSSQFPFRIYAAWRQNVVRRSRNEISPKQEAIAQCLAAHGEEEARNLCAYLKALRLCVLGDREGAEKIVSQHPIRTGIPLAWQKEARNILDYAGGTVHTFRRDQAIAEDSQRRSSRSLDREFAELLLQALGLSAEPLDSAGAEALYGRFAQARPGSADRLKAGTLLLGGLSGRQTPLRADIPGFAALALETALEAMEPAAGLSVDQRFALAARLYAQRRGYGAEMYQAPLARLSARFGELLNQKPGLTLWAEYAGTIEEYLTDTGRLSDFPLLRQHLLQPYQDRVSRGCSQEERYEALDRMLSTAAGLAALTSNVTRLVLDAVNLEKRRIEESPRLQVMLSHDTVQDGCLYFQLRNVGRHNISLREGYVVTVQVAGRRDREVELRNISELRSGFVTGHREKVVFQPDCATVKVAVKVERLGPNDSRILLCRTRETELPVEPGTREMRLRDTGGETRYAVNRAVSDGRYLFGRQALQRDLRRCIPRGVTVLYGPSRIGKTSLLNWVRRELAGEKGNVMTILYGGEAGRNRENDYQVNFTGTGREIPYGDDAKMSEYLLSQTILHGFGSPLRFRAPEKGLPQGLEEKILGIMGSPRRLTDRYYALDALLEKEDLELWLLLDEFQQVVEQWPAGDGCEFSVLCELLCNPQDGLKRIKLVACGSDDLLRHMVLDYQSDWKKIFRDAARISVEALEEEPFRDMIQQDPALEGTNIHFSREAQEALYAYTGGVALYGKEICNTLLRSIGEHPEGYAHRDTLYVSDVAWATQRLLDQQSGDLNNRDRESIASIYKAVTHNLDESTMVYLQYMARWLADHPESDGFPESLLTDRARRPSLGALADSLAIAKARGIIRPRSREEEKIWVFRTLFYYFAFRGLSQPAAELEGVIFLPEVPEADTAPEEDPVERLTDLFRQMRSQPKELYGLYREMSQADQESFRADFSQTVHYGDQVTGNKIGTQNIQMNTQIVQNSFQTLIAGGDPEEIRKALENMPSVGGYLTEPQREELAALEETLEFSEDREEIQATRSAMETITAPAEKKMLQDTVSAAVAMDNFYEVSDQRWQELLGLHDAEELKAIRELPMEIQGPLNFAVMLHNVFERIGENLSAGGDGEVDYCPVSIMYCKVVEALLKKVHTPLYIDRLGDLSVKSNGALFRELLAPDGTIQITKDVSIGSYAFHIVISPKTNSVDLPPERFRTMPVWGSIKRLSGNDSVNTSLNQSWSTHARELAVVLAVRNKSAHEAAPITRANFDWLIQVLFRDGELLRIARLAEGKA